MTASRKPPRGQRLTRFSFTCGALMRRHVRAYLDLHAMPYTEHKGLLDSVFIVSGTLDQHDSFRRWSEETFS